MNIDVKELKKFEGFDSDFRLTINGMTMRLDMNEATILMEKLTQALKDSNWEAHNLK